MPHLFSARKAQEEDSRQELKIRNNEKELQALRETTKKMTLEMERLQKKVGQLNVLIVESLTETDTDRRTDKTISGALTW